MDNVCKVCGNVYVYKRNDNCSVDRCKTCYVAGNRKKRKSLAIELFGGGCQRCGYSKCHESLCFHHVEKKSMSMSSGISVSWQKYVAELEKCLLLCHNCHHELHAGLWDASEVVRVVIGDDFKKLIIPTGRDYRKRQEFIGKQCPQCDQMFATKRKSQIYCSKECRSLGGRKWHVDNDEFAKLLWEMPVTRIAEIFGMSDTAVRKRAKILGLLKPHKGYWQKELYGKAKLI